MEWMTKIKKGTTLTVKTTIQTQNIAINRARIHWQAYVHWVVKTVGFLYG
jgi:hypothetical protein